MNEVFGRMGKRITLEDTLKHVSAELLLVNYQLSMNDVTFENNLVRNSCEGFEIDFRNFELQPLKKSDKKPLPNRETLP